MKKMFFSLMFVAVAAGASAQIKMPAPSSTQKIKQDFALGAIELTYSRPSIKGRKIFGDLVPMDKVWRTGANNATLLKFNDVVEMGGKLIDTGTYALYTIPGEDSWEIILNKGKGNWGVNGYSTNDDVVRFKVKPMTMRMPTETFTMQFANIMPESCELHLMWDRTAVAVPIKANIRERLRADVEKSMTGDKKAYFAAAQFYNEYEMNKSKALEAMNGAVAENPKAFWMWLYKAKIESDMGNKTAAMASSKTSWELAKEAKNDDYVKMNEDLQKKLK